MSKDVPAQAIDVYYWPTPNGRKITILLEELGWPYTVKFVDIGRGEQFEPSFLEISPNNRMPTIVDPDGSGGSPISIFESGAILRYLALKAGQFYPNDLRGQAKVVEWLFWQVGGLGPMAGQAHHFRQYAKDQLPYAIDRYTREVGRLYSVMDKRLKTHEFLAGEYSIADMASFPWVVPYRNQGQDLVDFQNLKRWFDTLKTRPAVSRGLEVGEERRGDPNRLKTDDKAREILFGITK